ncbi:hypothetical protein B6S12_02980 [Helicobacter valdiviensis]|uniref:Uncharacterized protein n=1 Tax=Helicobacter valdiviensis TaxID=1458358 RepID=A0A2W6MXC4_9HELI|nr:hypothetical protein [Helicobacter valdiviensis]PZT48619.1 hypothetical protein B6S12_02980 [Helicobacter valdiviensis]
MAKIFKIFLLGFVFLLQARGEEYQLYNKEEIIKFVKQDSANFLKYKKQYKNYYEEFNKINQALILVVSKYSKGRSILYGKRFSKSFARRKGILCPKNY